jgi:radical SAM protein with 4Fe4S-binding SPASM domain
MRRKGIKIVALYGASAEVHDHITRTPGSYDSVMQGIAYLKEAVADFTVQVIPMRDNYHQLDGMKALAQNLSPHWRVGADWLYLSACGDAEKNRSIMRQRLDPKEVVNLDKADLSYEEWARKEKNHRYSHLEKDNRLFAACIATRRDFHIDPYGHMSFCRFVKDSDLRYDLRKGSFTETWESFIPSLAEKVKGGEEYRENCRSCRLQNDCRWCPVYGYLEHGRFSAKVEYLCDIAREKKGFRQRWINSHRRYYKIGGITIQVDSDLPIAESTFHPKFKPFQVNGPGKDTIFIRHHFSVPKFDDGDLGKEVYRKPPWAIYKKGNSWVYVDISSTNGDRPPRQVAVFNQDHTSARIYNDEENTFRRGGLASLTLFPTDQTLLAQVLATRQACFLHSSGVIIDGNGLLFVGHSDAGKSTIATMLKAKAKILCDDRIIVRRSNKGFKVHGTWSHGDLPEVSADSAPLKAIMFLKQAGDNLLKPVDDRQEMIRKVLSCLIRPLVTRDWLEKMLDLVGDVVREVPCYNLYFDKSGKVVDLLSETFWED